MGKQFNTMIEMIGDIHVNTHKNQENIFMLIFEGNFIHVQVVRILSLRLVHTYEFGVTGIGR
jgi:hypothetical protein